MRILLILIRRFLIIIECCLIFRIEGLVPNTESYAEAAKDTNWRAVMEEEMHAFAENETWDLIDAPKGVKPIGCRWVYKVKYNIASSVSRYKARLVVKGYT